MLAQPLHPAQHSQLQVKNFSFHSHESERCRDNIYSMKKLMKSTILAITALFLVSSVAFAQQPTKMDVANYAGSTFGDWFDAVDHFGVSEQALARVLGFNDVIEAYAMYSYYHVTCYTINTASFGTADSLGVDISEGADYGAFLMSEWMGFIPECGPDTSDEVELAIFGEFWTVMDTPSVPWHFRANGVIFYPAGFPVAYIDVFEEEWLGYDSQGDLQDIMMDLVEVSIDIMTDDIYYLLAD